MWILVVSQLFFMLHCTLNIENLELINNLWHLCCNYDVTAWLCLWKYMVWQCTKMKKIYVVWIVIEFALLHSCTVPLLNKFTYKCELWLFHWMACYLCCTCWCSNTSGSGRGLMIENHVYAAMLHHNSHPLTCRWIELTPMLQRRANHAVVVACTYNLLSLYTHSHHHKLLWVN